MSLPMWLTGDPALVDLLQTVALILISIHLMRIKKGKQ